MSSASQQFTAASGATYEHTDYNGEIGNLITHINNIYSFIDDSTGTSPLTVDTTNDRLGINITSPLSELHVADAAGSVEGRFDSTITGTTYGLYMGADANEPYIGSRTNHGLRIITNGVAAAYFETTKKLRLYSEGSVTDYAHIYSSTANNLVLSPYANGDVIALGRHPRRNSGSASYQTAHIQTGWFYALGVGENQAIGDSFDIPFSSDNVRVFLQIIGERAIAAGTPDDEGFFTSASASECSVRSVTATGFSGLLWSQSGSGIDSSTNYGFAWIAIGPV